MLHTKFPGFQGLIPKMMIFKRFSCHIIMGQAAIFVNGTDPFEITLFPQSKDTLGEVCLNYTRQLQRRSHMKMLQMETKQQWKTLSHLQAALEPLAQVT